MVGNGLVFYILGSRILVLLIWLCEMFGNFELGRESTFEFGWLAGLALFWFLSTLPRSLHAQIGAKIGTGVLKEILLVFVYQFSF